MFHVFVIDPYLSLAVNGVKTDRTQFCIGETFTAECFIPARYILTARTTFFWGSFLLFKEGAIQSSWFQNNNKYRGSLYTFMDRRWKSILTYTIGSQIFGHTTLRCSNKGSYYVELSKTIAILGMLLFC